MWGAPTRRIRILSQWLTFGLWVALILATKYPMDSFLAQTLPVSLFLRIDPLVMTVVSGGMRVLLQITLLGFVTLAVSLIMGRVFCGWVCPLGSVFDAYGWILRRLRVRFEGPSPAWFRLKYYLLFSMLIFALLGGVSPLMGLDPIVLITRLAAVVVGPFARTQESIFWSASDQVGFHGVFVDLSTLVLFLIIMVGTTKVSRIWCRTACPLGAYLALLSRNALLRRDTKGCIHCNICSNHCPTGAISFENPEIYNESECIKCFACSQECPVDANFFTWKSPIPAVTYSHAPVSLERRTLVGTAMATVAVMPGMRLASGDTTLSKRLIRPPMSREERDFLTSCIRCAECMKACPTGVLKPAGLEHGVRALWSPVLTPTEGYCKSGCSACSQACPTDAIMKYPIEKKNAYKLGTAVFESDKCISYTENKFCSECVRLCPTDAIEYTSGWEPPGGIKNAKGADAPAPDGQLPTRPIRISFERCIGCGACEWACNQIVFAGSAMVTTSYGRAVPTKLSNTEASEQTQTPQWDLIQMAKKKA
jgi:ferredoxin